MSVAKLTKEQAAILGAYTGVLCGSFADLHEYAEKLLGRSIFTHEFGSASFAEALRSAAKEDFIAICPGA